MSKTEIDGVALYGILLKGGDENAKLSRATTK